MTVDRKNLFFSHADSTNFTKSFSKCISLKYHTTLLFLKISQKNY